jgi:hypothetical protein
LVYKGPASFFAKKGGKRDFVTWESMACEKDKDKGKPKHTHSMRLYTCWLASLMSHLLAVVAKVTT